ncbi:conjugative transfer ATPase, partial [Pseudomonas syringae pv. pisi]
MTLFQRLKSRASLNSATQTDIAGDPLLSEPSAVELEQPEDDLVEDLKASDQNDVDAALERYLKRLEDQGIPAPGDWRNPKQKPATVGDVAALYDVKPSFVDLLPWIEYLPAEQAMLLEDGKSLAAFFELTPIGTEGRDPEWLRKVRDALENALQNSFDELDTSPWVVQFYAKDETSWDDYLRNLRE